MAEVYIFMWNYYYFVRKDYERAEDIIEASVLQAKFYTAA